MSLEDTVLSEVLKWCGERGLKLKALVIFGSYVLNPVKARDVDLLVVVERLNVKLREVILMSVELSSRLRKISGRSYDVVLLDEGSLHENVQPGTVLSGLILGYRVIYDEVGINDLVSTLTELLANTDYRYFKGRWVDLSTLARARKAIHRDF